MTAESGNQPPRHSLHEYPQMLHLPTCPATKTCYNGFMSFESPKHPEVEKEADDLEQARVRMAEIKTQWDELFAEKDSGAIDGADFDARRKALVDENAELEKKLGM